MPGWPAHLTGRTTPASWDAVEPPRRRGLAVPAGAGWHRVWGSAPTGGCLVPGRPVAADHRHPLFGVGEFLVGRSGGVPGPHGRADAHLGRSRTHQAPQSPVPVPVLRRWPRTASTRLGTGCRCLRAAGTTGSVPRRAAGPVGVAAGGLLALRFCRLVPRVPEPASSAFRLRHQPTVPPGLSSVSACPTYGRVGRRCGWCAGSVVADHRRRPTRADSGALSCGQRPVCGLVTLEVGGRGADCGR